MGHTSQDQAGKETGSFGYLPNHSACEAKQALLV